MASKRRPKPKPKPKPYKRDREMSETQGARVDQRGVRSDPGFGTAPGALGLVKMQSEEARHETCAECGHGGGRHARVCARYSA